MVSSKDLRGKIWLWAGRIIIIAALFNCFIKIQEHDRWRFIFISGSACLSEASFGPLNINIQISCPEFIKQLKRGNDYYSACPEPYPHRKSFEDTTPPGVAYRVARSVSQAYKKAGKLNNSSTFRLLVLFLVGSTMNDHIVGRSVYLS